ncbi:hypothetical protein [Rhizohabitans arisaemae]|uniref:hypothetical protein n=1 Tax=Rhizohabitans arisaemae TaxID=2720610 RepID=UPI0024B10852|nr:hypothetical protein [Rhizohabitans arisaemae]
MSDYTENDLRDVLADRGEGRTPGIVRIDEMVRRGRSLRRRRRAAGVGAFGGLVAAGILLLPTILGGTAGTDQTSSRWLAVPSSSPGLAPLELPEFINHSEAGKLSLIHDERHPFVDGKTITYIPRSENALTLIKCTDPKALVITQTWVPSWRESELNDDGAKKPIPAATEEPTSAATGSIDADSGGVQGLVKGDGRAKGPSTSLMQCGDAGTMVPRFMMPIGPDGEGGVRTPTGPDGEGKVRTVKVWVLPSAVDFNVGPNTPADPSDAPGDPSDAPAGNTEPRDADSATPPPKPGVIGRWSGGSDESSGTVAGGIESTAKVQVLGETFDFDLNDPEKSVAAIVAKLGDAAKAPGQEWVIGIYDVPQQESTG